ncbi:MAG: UDP-N-acetylmuramoyl-tripeptide--D-alanyl-D-alanine ligase [Ignavibacteria bacterium]|nr:UDP-N-acetylmuramoyl-tripeptide--D-alanyl-D-alanine ligase [Ignavibacteria bacterium]
MNLSLDDLKKISGFKIINAEKFKNKKFTGVSIDSRKCSKNDLFIAIKGEKFDGHNFVSKVFLNGTQAAVVAENWYKKNKVSINRSLNNKYLIIVKDTVKALGEIARIYRNKFVLPVIGIGGSNGKTTTKDFIAEVLSVKYNVLKTKGNLNNQIGVPLTLFELNNKHDIAVIELGTNHFGEIDSLCRIAQPQFGLITNIGKEHLEFLNDLKGTAKAEGELAEYLKEFYGTFFLNADDKYLLKYKNSKNLKKISFGFKGKCDINGKVTGFTGFKPKIEITSGKKKITAQLKNIGLQSSYAALCAAAVGFYFEIPVQKLKQVLSGYKIKSNSRNQLKTSNSIMVIDDTYNSNPDSVKAALENLKAYNVKGNKYVVLGDMLELGKVSKAEHEATGRLIKKMGFNFLLTYGKQSSYTFKSAKGIKNNFHFENKETLSAFLKLHVKKGDMVLVKGSRSMKMEDIVNNLISKN